MSIKKKDNNKHDVEIVDQNNEGIQRTFLKKTEALVIEVKIQELKYKKKFSG